MGNDSSFSVYILNAETKRKEEVFSREGIRSYNHNNVIEEWEEIESLYKGKVPYCEIFKDDYSYGISCYDSQGEYVNGVDGSTDDCLYFYIFSWEGLTIINYNIYDIYTTPNFPVLRISPYQDNSARKIELEKIEGFGVNTFGCGSMLGEYFLKPSKKEIENFKNYFSKQFKDLFKVEYVEQFIILLLSMDKTNIELMMNLLLANGKEYLK